MFLGKIKGIIDFSSLPKAVEQNCKLSGNGNDGSLFGILATPFGELEPPATKVTIRSEGTQDVLSGTDEQLAEERVTGFSDAELRVVVARLISTWDEAQGGTDLTAFWETTGVFDGEDKSQ